MKTLKKLSLFIALLSTTAFGQFSFTPSTSTGCAPLAISFTNTSTLGQHYDWDMGDGTTYTDQTNATHTFAQGGGYWVTMYAFSATYNYIGSEQMYIEVTGPPSEISMPSVVCPGDNVGM